MRSVFLFGIILGLESSLMAAEINSQERDGPCYWHCSGTYPQHTYPVPEDFSACTRGCRIAVMDALMSWPFPPERCFCSSTCQQAYSSSNQQYACQTGCNVTTVDQKVPNADQTNPPNDDVGLLFGFLDTVSQQLMGRQDDYQAQLTQQAEALEQLLPKGGRITTVLVMEGKEGAVQIKYEEGVVEVPSYGYEEQNDPVWDGEEGTKYRLSCPWNYTALGRFLSVVGLVLVLVAIVTCCCSSLLSEDNQQQEEESINKRKVEMKKVLVQSQLKMSPLFSSGYPQPVAYYSEKKIPLL